MEDRVRYYILEGLAALPGVLERLLANAGDAEFDRRPDPARFTIREVVAHLADWEPIWLERIERIATEDRPLLQGYDEGKLAIEHDYARSDVREQLGRFREGRARTLSRLHGLSDEQWKREGIHTEWNRLTIADLTTLILGHDGYHARQVAEWLAAR